MKYISPQVVILRALKNNGSLTTVEISNKTGISLNRVHASAKHLLSRSLVRKKTVNLHQFSPGLVSTWTIREQKREKIERMIKEAYPDAYSD